ncbi:hypothetical protein DL771_009409 [Monosporascus sp. 5C6A]|nr:hypothetical protein DL771_009409 [Monosporascus sp. 5C6A]
MKHCRREGGTRGNLSSPPRPGSWDVEKHPAIAWMWKNEVEFIEPTTGALADGFMLEYQSATTFYEPNISECVSYRLGLDSEYQNPTSRWGARSRPGVRVQRQGFDKWLISHGVEMMSRICTWCVAGLDEEDQDRVVVPATMLTQVGPVHERVAHAFERDLTSNGHHYNYMTTIPTNIEKSTMSTPKSAPATSLGELDDGRARTDAISQAMPTIGDEGEEVRRRRGRGEVCQLESGGVHGQGRRSAQRRGREGDPQQGPVEVQEQARGQEARLRRRDERPHPIIGGPELKNSEHFTKFGFPKANLGPIFETMNTAVPGVLNSMSSTARYYWTKPEASTPTQGPTRTPTRPCTGTPTSPRPCACSGGRPPRVSPRSPSPWPATRRRWAARSSPAAPTDLGFSVKCYNFVHLEKVYWHGPPQSASVGVELEGAGGLGPRPGPAVTQSLLSQTGDAFGGTNPFASKPSGINRPTTSANTYL